MYVSNLIYSVLNSQVIEIIYGNAKYTHKLPSLMYIHMYIEEIMKQLGNRKAFLSSHICYVALMSMYTRTEWSDRVVHDLRKNSFARKDRSHRFEFGHEF